MTTGQAVTSNAPLLLIPDAQTSILISQPSGIPILVRRPIVQGTTINDSRVPNEPKSDGKEANSDEVTEVNSIPFPIKTPDKKLVGILKRKLPIPRTPEPYQKKTKEDQKLDKKVSLQNVHAKFPTDKKCTKCQKPFDTLHELLQHMALEHDIHFQFKCDLCNFDFRSNSVLIKHKKEVHEGKKPFKCKICDTSFARKPHLESHISRTHEGKKAFKCDICHVGCARKSLLEKHMDSVHTTVLSQI